MKSRLNILCFALLFVFASISAAAQSPNTSNEQCNWWGRETYPICENRSSGWGRENGVKCISRDACINDQPDERGGIISTPGENTSSEPTPMVSPTTAPTPAPTPTPTPVTIPTPQPSSNVDQCNTTSQCQAIFGNNATDCKDSRSSNSVCMCGNIACSEENPSDNSGSDQSGECKLDTPAKGIPEITLFTVKGKSTVRENFCSVEKWYGESDYKQVFRLFKGDDMSKHVSGGRKHARTEAQHGLLFKAGSEWREFEGTFKIEGDRPPITITVAQLFAGCCGPVARVEMRTSGRIHVGSTADGNTRISDDADYFGKSFTIKIRSNGKNVEVYFNNTLKYQGSVRYKDALYHFRWGVYSNEIPIGNFQNTVTNVTRK